MYMLSEFLPNLRFVIMVFVLSAFVGLATKRKFDLAFTAMIISLGISYGAFILFTLISSSLVRIITGTIDVILATILAALLHCVSIIFLFRIRRFSKGILFLHKKSAGAVGMTFSGVIVLIFVLINRGISAETGAWLLVGVILSIAGMIFWWRHGITKQYREKVKERNMQELKRIISEQETRIQNLTKDNEAMAKLIHRDNRLLPALHDAVSIILESNTNLNNDRKNVLNQIEQHFEERAGMIQSQLAYKPLQTTKDLVLDSIMNQMMKNASEKGIEFNIVVIGYFIKLIDKIIPAVKLQTLCADLIENAIIATSTCEHKQILVTLKEDNGIFELSVQDSGIPFNPDTLINLGVEKMSTRMDDGGSGIGYITIFDILRECRASLVITEYKPRQSDFTKSVNVCFDGNCAYTVNNIKQRKITT